MRLSLHPLQPALMERVWKQAQPLVLQRPSAQTLASLTDHASQARALHAVRIESMVAVPLVAHGRVLGGVAFLSSTPSRRYDATDVRLAEELAQRAALSIENARLYRAAQWASRAREELLAVVAHDLRNPLSRIVMQASKLSGAAPADRARSESIVSAARQMNRLIQDLLDVTRIEAGGLSVDPRRAPSVPLLAEAVEAQRPLAAAASLSLTLHAPQGLPEVWADRARILQALENLLTNAIKFTPAGGHLTVGATSAEDRVVFWVKDTGVGISKEQLPHLFEKFWQAQKGERRGAGLGLPIVQGIVHAHCGRIWVESEPGEGSTFYFSLPTAQLMESHLPPQHP